MPCCITMIDRSSIDLLFPRLAIPRPLRSLQLVWSGLWHARDLRSGSCHPTAPIHRTRKSLGRFFRQFFWKKIHTIISSTCKWFQTNYSLLSSTVGGRLKHAARSINQSSFFHSFSAFNCVLYYRLPCAGE